MYSDRSDPLLAQVPLTVSPFVSLPTATTLPYTYKSLPPSLPPSSTADRSTTGKEGSKPKFVVSSSGQAAHPEEIFASCQALQSHLEKVQSDAATTWNEWEKAIEARELAEKRRVAPGWLDSQQTILEPQRAAQPDAQQNLVTSLQSSTVQTTADDAPQRSIDDAEGRALDEAFGSLRTH